MKHIKIFIAGFLIVSTFIGIAISGLFLLFNYPGTLVLILLAAGTACLMYKVGEDFFWEGKDL